MNVDGEILRSALTHPSVFYPVTWEPAPEGFIQWMHQMDIEENLVDFYTNHCPSESAQLGCAMLHDSEEIREFHEEYPRLLAERLFAVGASSNGDTIAIDLSSGMVGYISHEFLCNPTLYGDPNNIREKFDPVAVSLGAFVLGLIKDSIPIDAHRTWSEVNEDGLWDEEGIKPEINPWWKFW